jgi:hypothetical protein
MKFRGCTGASIRETGSERNHQHARVAATAGFHQPPKRFVWDAPATHNDERSGF